MDQEKLYRYSYNLSLCDTSYSKEFNNSFSSSTEAQSSLELKLAPLWQLRSAQYYS